MTGRSSTRNKDKSATFAHNFDDPRRRQEAFEQYCEWWRLINAISNAHIRATCDAFCVCMPVFAVIVVAFQLWLLSCRAIHKYLPIYGRLSAEFIEYFPFLARRVIDKHYMAHKRTFSERTVCMHTNWFTALLAAPLMSALRSSFTCSQDEMCRDIYSIGNIKSTSSRLARTAQLWRG